MRITQTNETKARIYQGFKSLVLSTPYDNITLSSIATKAGVARMTLYRHFESKEAILLGYLTTMQQTVEHRLPSIKNAGLNDLLLLRHQLLASEPVLQRLIQQPSLYNVMQRFALNNIEKFTMPMQQQMKQHLLLQSFVFGGLERATQQWFANGCQPSAEEFTNQLLLLLQPMMQFTTNQ